MGALFSPPNAPTPTAPPAVPTPADPAIAQRNEQLRLRALSGRASTYLTNPNSQMDAEPSAARQLGAA
jgi:hypothetical protein